VSLTELDRAAGHPIQQGGGPWVGGGEVARQHGRPLASGGDQAIAQLLHLRLLRTSQDDSERIEQHQLGVAPHRLRDIVPACLANEPHQPFDLFTHNHFSFGLGFRGRVERAT
jgi:hypothetical protein